LICVSIVIIKIMINYPKVGLLAVISITILINIDVADCRGK